TEIAALDLTDGGEAGTRPAVGILAEATELESQRHRLRHALERELAVEEVVVAVVPDAGGAEGHHLVGIDVEEVGAADVVVTIRVAGVDRAEVDLGGHARLERVLSGDDVAAEGAELASHLAHHH